MEPPRRGRFGEMAYVPCREVGHISEVCIFFPLYHPNTCLFPIYNELFTVGVSNDSDSISGVATRGSIRAQALVNF